MPMPKCYLCGSLVSLINTKTLRGLYISKFTNWPDGSSEDQIEALFAAPR